MRKEEAFVGATVVTPDGHDGQIIDAKGSRKTVKVVMPDATTQIWKPRKLKRTVETL